MLTTKMVVRILDEKDRLLGWTEVMAEARGDGCLWATGSAVVVIEVSGTPIVQSIHWADVNVETRTPVISGPRVIGDVMTLSWPKAMMCIGAAAGGLPPVTVRSRVSIGVPAGILGAQAT